MVLQERIFCILKTYTLKMLMEKIMKKNGMIKLKRLVGEYIDHTPTFQLAYVIMLLQKKLKQVEGLSKWLQRKPFKIHTLEEIGWENFLGMTVGQAVVWASQDIDPKYTNPELTTSEPYVMGSHATCSGAWVSGPEDIVTSRIFLGI